MKGSNEIRSHVLNMPNDHKRKYTNYDRIKKNESKVSYTTSHKVEKNYVIIVRLYYDHI